MKNNQNITMASQWILAEFLIYFFKITFIVIRLLLKVPLLYNFAGLNYIHRPTLQAFAFSIMSTLVFTRCSSRTL